MVIRRQPLGKGEGRRPAQAGTSSGSSLSRGQASRGRAEDVARAWLSIVMAGLDSAISIRDALCHPKRDHRDKPGDDKVSLPRPPRTTDSIVKQPLAYRQASSPLFFAAPGAP
jgi:hypothetical protein